MKTPDKALYCLYDKIAKEAGNIFTAKNDDVALRQVKNTFKESAYMHPEEYQLFRLGFYNNETLEITALKQEITISKPLASGQVREKFADYAEYPPDPALYKEASNV